jgi:ribose transport system ATP-binding protein
MTTLVELKNIVKTFGGLQAVKKANFSLAAGEVHALLGENGAGKSTLMRVLGGETIHDSGEVVINGKPVAFHSPADARAEGIAVIHQELVLAPDLTVAENIFLGELPRTISYRALNARAKALIERLGFHIDANALVGNLAVAHQQVVEIAKALSYDARVIVFDEPTSVLATKDAHRLHKIIGELRARGVGVVYISHRLDEVFEVADRMTVMKDGEVVGTTTPEESGIDEVIRMMVGRPLSTMFPQRDNKPSAEDLLTVRNLRAGRRVRGVSFSIKGGEIVGLGGLVGAGRTEVARLIFGADRLESGEILLRGKPMKFRSPTDAVKAGIGLLPEDRKGQGVALDKPIRVNVTMARMAAVIGPFGFIRNARERRLVTDLGGQLRLKASSVDAPVSSLSGGNQQKIVLAKWFHADGLVFLLDEPTRGVDVGAKAEIYGLITELAKAGKAVLMISSEHQELFGLCDRVLVMREGELRGELTRDQYSEENLLTLAMTKSGRTMQEEEVSS